MSLQGLLRGPVSRLGRGAASLKVIATPASCLWKMYATWEIGIHGSKDICGLKTDIIGVYFER